MLLKAITIHVIEEDIVGQREIVMIAGGRQSGRDQDGIRVARANTLAACREQLNVGGRIRTLIPPFAAEIGFVPDLIGGDFATVAFSDRGAICSPGLQIGRWRVLRQQMVNISRPEGHMAEPGDEPQTAALNLAQDAIGLAPIPDAGLRLEIAPGKGLLDVTEGHQPDPVEVRADVSAIPPEEGLNAVGQRGKGRIHNGACFEWIRLGLQVTPNRQRE